jgi:8-oxo-dGTP diphosphatase
LENNTREQIKQSFGGRIRIRVCGVLVEEGKILLAEHLGLGPKGRLLIPPGGGLEFGEDIFGCLKREYKEETGLEIEVDNLLFVNEFIKKPLHAIELFYRVRRVSGELIVGFDPELDLEAQIIKEVRFYSHKELLNLDSEVLHKSLQYEPDPIKFEHLTGFFNFVGNS